MSDTLKLFELVYLCNGPDITPHEIHEYLAAPNHDNVRAHYEKETAKGPRVELVAINEISLLETFIATLSAKRGTRNENGVNITHKNHITFLD